MQSHSSTPVAPARDDEVLAAILRDQRAFGGRLCTKHVAYPNKFCFDCRETFCPECNLIEHPNCTPGNTIQMRKYMHEIVVRRSELEPFMSHVPSIRSYTCNDKPVFCVYRKTGIILCDSPFKCRSVDCVHGLPDTSLYFCSLACAAGDAGSSESPKVFKVTKKEFAVRKMRSRKMGSPQRSPEL